MCALRLRSQASVTHDTLGRVPVGVPPGVPGTPKGYLDIREANGWVEGCYMPTPHHEGGPLHV